MRRRRRLFSPASLCLRHCDSPAILVLETLPHYIPEKRKFSGILCFRQQHSRRRVRRRVRRRHITISLLARPFCQTIQKKKLRIDLKCTKAYWCHILAWNATRNFQLGCRNFQLKLEISSWTKWKFPVRTRNFQFECRNFQFEEVEISSSNSKFPVRQSGNFQFELEISSWNVEISNLKK